MWLFDKGDWVFPPRESLSTEEQTEGLPGLSEPGGSPVDLLATRGAKQISLSQLVSHICECLSCHFVCSLSLEDESQGAGVLLGLRLFPRHPKSVTLV